MFWDPFLILLLPALALALWAQARMKSTYAKYARIPTRSGMTGAQIAQSILQAENVQLANDPADYPPGSACGLEAIPGKLGDHYDPRTRMLRLSEGVYHGQSVAALGIAAHEAGHAIQHAQLYSPLMLRGLIYPVCNFGSMAAWPLFLGGLFLSIPPLLRLGVLLFALSVIFTLITLPVEFNASSRALKALAAGGRLEQDELIGARKVLIAAALTYVAAAAMAIMQLVRMIFLANARD